MKTIIKNIGSALAGVLLGCLATPQVDANNTICATCNMPDRQFDPLSNSHGENQSVHSISDVVWKILLGSTTPTRANTTAHQDHSVSHSAYSAPAYYAHENEALPRSLELSENQPAWYSASLNRPFSQMHPYFEPSYGTPYGGLSGYSPAYPFAVSQSMFPVPPYLQTDPYERGAIERLWNNFPRR
jgi:hypothetical protein